MNNNNCVVAVYKLHTEAEAAINELNKSGFDMKKLSIIGRDYHTDEHVIGYYNTGDRMKYWGKLGAFWGGFWGCLLYTSPASACIRPSRRASLRRHSPPTPPAQWRRPEQKAHVYRFRETVGRRCSSTYDTGKSPA